MNNPSTGTVRSVYSYRPQQDGFCQILDPAAALYCCTEINEGLSGDLTHVFDLGEAKGTRTPGLLDAHYRGACQVRLSLAGS